jgi:hypothetical protein
MRPIDLGDLQETVQDTSGFGRIEDYFAVTEAFLMVLPHLALTRIVSPTNTNYIFYQYGENYGHNITRPLNSDLFLESVSQFRDAAERFFDFLSDLRTHQENAIELPSRQDYVTSSEMHKVIYTVQQSIGSIADSFVQSNQARKRAGQLFEGLIKLILQSIGVECEGRTVRLPIPGFADYQMPYELDVVFSRNRAIVTSETQFIHANEVVGSVKTTSKDRIDKIFLDKYLLSKLLQRNIPVVAIFLHDVQRARRGNSIFGINSTFKTNHFLGYTVALTSLDGVYYVDPRPEMIVNERLREQIHHFQRFLVRDLWILSDASGSAYTAQPRLIDL